MKHISTLIEAYIAKKGWRTCPTCKKLYGEHPALSRKDNKTEICSNCGTSEALQDYLYRAQNSPQSPVTPINL